MANHTLVSTLAGFFTGIFVMCCTPSVTQSIQETKSSCSLKKSVDNAQKDEKESKDFVEGTGWIIKLDDTWKKEKLTSNDGLEFSATKRGFKSVKFATGSIVVVPWNECPIKFINEMSQSYIEITGSTPIGDVAIDINGQTWYIFTFKDPNGPLGVFATTANHKYGYAVQCVTVSENISDTVDVCSDFISGIILKEKRDLSKEQKKNDGKKEEKKKTRDDKKIIFL